MSDFNSRWRRAREQALRSIAGVAGLTELELIGSVAEDDRDLALKRVFEQSRRLGLSVSRFLGLSWEISDFRDVLAASGEACLAGAWESTRLGVTLVRPGCAPGGKIGSFFCDYWREAIDGLMMGAGGSERFARRASRGHGDPGCEDVFFDDALDARGMSARFTPVPERLTLGLAGLTEGFARLGAKLRLLGLAEGALHFTLESDGAPHCGAEGRSLRQTLANEVARLFPGLALQDASPLAVYGEGTR